MLLEQSVDDVNNHTEMNLVNDTSGITQMNSQIQLNNDYSQVTLTNVNQDQTQSQVLLDVSESAAYGNR